MERRLDFVKAIGNCLEQTDIIVKEHLLGHLNALRGCAKVILLTLNVTVGQPVAEQRQGGDGAVVALLHVHSFHHTKSRSQPYLQIVHFDKASSDGIAIRQSICSDDGDRLLCSLLQSKS